MRSLRWKLSAAFLLTSVLCITVPAALIQRITFSEFDQLRSDQQLDNFVEAAATYYSNARTWSGIELYLETFNSLGYLPLPGQPGNGNGQGQGQQGQGNRPGNPFIIPANGNPPLGANRPQFLLVSLDGIALNSAGNYLPGQRVRAADMQGSEVMTVNGIARALVITFGNPPELSEREQSFLARVTQALALAALMVVVAAVLIGFGLASQLTRPLRQLTVALKTFRHGQTQPIPTRSRDEIGQLVNAFNQMSTELTQAELLRQQMTADIAHELRSPLTVVTGYLEAMRDGTLAPTQERFDVLHGEALQLQRLIDDLRTLSLADAGQLRLERERVEVRDLLEDTQRAFAHQAASQKIRLSISVTHELPPVLVDPSRLSQVLGNLVSNALRYTPEGGCIELVGTSTAHGARLTVRDNGAGIAPDALPNLFQRFFRADASRQSDDGNTGLGLAIARAIIEAHQGKLSAESAGIGQGSVFHIDLPAAPLRT
jgi:signal transduction histidine kinase